MKLNYFFLSFWVYIVLLNYAIGQLRVKIFFFQFDEVKHILILSDYQMLWQWILRVLKTSQVHLNSVETWESSSRSALVNCIFLLQFFYILVVYDWGIAPRFFWNVSTGFVIAFWLLLEQSDRIFSNTVTHVWVQLNSLFLFREYIKKQKIVIENISQKE